MRRFICACLMNAKTLKLAYISRLQLLLLTQALPPPPPSIHPQTIYTLIDTLSWTLFQEVEKANERSSVCKCELVTVLLPSFRQILMNINTTVFPLTFLLSCHISCWIYLLPLPLPQVCVLSVQFLATLEATCSSINRSCNIINSSTTLYALVFCLVEKVVGLAKTY